MLDDIQRFLIHESYSGFGIRFESASYYCYINLFTKVNFRYHV